MSEFDKWNKQKQGINQGRDAVPKYKEIWWTRVGKNIGFEQNGSGEIFLRPVLVFRVFNSKMFFGIPMTSGAKNEKSTYYFKMMHNNKKYFLLLPQARLFSTKRLHQFIREISNSEMVGIKVAFKKLMRI